MMTVIRLILFFLSSLGVWELLRGRFRIHICFVPGLTIALQSCLVLLGGLLQILPAAVLCVFLAGLACLAYAVIQSRGLHFLRSYLHPAYLMLLVMCVILLILLRGHLFSHYDNFSHWALVVKQMLFTNRFPDAQDLLIEFRDYPPGSASYIYFMAKVVSGSEPMQMFAQAYAILCCLMPVFLWCRKHAAAAWIAGMAGAYFILVYNISVTDLLVDTLLPAAAMSSFLYAWTYGRQIRRGTELSFWLLGIWLIWLVQIKTAGIFFALFVVLGIVPGIRKDRQIFPRICVALMPALAVLIWKWHVNAAFGAGDISKHALSAAYYTSVFGAKSPETVDRILSGMLQKAVTFPDVWIVFGIWLAAGVLVWIFARSERRIYGKLALFCVILYAAYELGLLLMYLFSMPETEALYLAEIERYERCILTAVLYLFLTMLIRLISEEIPGNAISVLVSAGLAGALSAVLLVSLGKIPALVDPSQPIQRLWLEQAARTYEIPGGSSYVICAPEEDGAYLYYLGRYLFYSPYVADIHVTEPADLDAYHGQYLFVMDPENPVIREWVEAHYPEQAGQDVIVCTVSGSSEYDGTMDKGIS